MSKEETPQQYLESLGFGSQVFTKQFFNDDDKSFYTIAELMESYAQSQLEEKEKELERLEKQDDEWAKAFHERNNQLDKLTQLLKEMRDRLDQMLQIEKFITDDRCKECGGVGAHAVGDPEDPDWEQCRMCYERDESKKALSKLKQHFKE